MRSGRTASSADRGGAPRPRVVVVGAGFGGLACATRLAREEVEVTVIDRRNHHVFQPLLYQVATAGLSPADIAWPVRSVLRGQDNARVVLAEATGIDVEGRTVRTGAGDFPYDYLVLATGARHAYFGHDSWEVHAPGLKGIEDATGIRRRILLAFEYAEMEPDPVRRRRWLTFVIVGGGPTGVELAGALIELSRKALAADFRRIDPRQTQVVLVEAGRRLLGAFPAPLSDFAQRALSALGVDVRLGAPVTGCDAGGVVAGDRRIEANTVLWAAGVEASPAGRWLGSACDGAGRIRVAADLTVPGAAGVYAVGDTVVVEGGDPLPGIAPVAKQQGAYVARCIACAVRGKPAPPAFRYRSMGQLATIGRKAAVIDFGRVRMKGRLAWWVWGIAHIYYLIGMRNRMLVAIQWLWSYFTFQRGGRLITGDRTDQGI